MNLNISRLNTILKNVWNHPSNSNEKVIRILRFISWQIIKRLINKAILIDSNNKEFLAFPDCTISSMLIYYKQPELEELNIIKKYSGGSNTFFDVGANIGLYTIMLLGDFKSFHSFEPNPIALNRFRINVLLNNASDIVNFNNMGVSKFSGNMFLKVDGDVDPTAHLVDSKDSTNSISVPVVSLDNYILLNNIKGTILVKIDVEGGELDVLKGMKNTLKQCKYSLIQYECLNNKYFNIVYEFIDDYQYTVCCIDNNKLKIVNKRVDGINNYFLLNDSLLD
jgi:FkbM family methyltransferase